jgi:hypothetical protein
VFSPERGIEEPEIEEPERGREEPERGIVEPERVESGMVEKLLTHSLR